MSHKVSIVIEKDDAGFYAYCPELEGCQTQGDTFEEVMANIKEAIELYLSTLSNEEIKASLSREKSGGSMVNGHYWSHIAFPFTISFMAGL